MKKIYAVKQGRQTGLFNTWDECRRQVDGFAGARYKGFASAGEAMQWLTGKAAEAAPAAASAPAVRRKRPVQAAMPGMEAAALPETDYIVYTDGSCLRNPDGPGGYAAVLLQRGSTEPVTIHGGEPSTTNNRMEMRAAIEALQAIDPSATILLYTDSQYLKRGFTNHWVRNWKRNGWKTAKGTDVLNKDLWMQLDALLAEHKVTFQWVKGHAGHEYNEQCDELAKSEAFKFAR